MRVLICGSRYWDDYETIERVLRELHQSAGVELVIHGGARGADTLGGRAAGALNIPVRVYPALWSQYGRSAGIRRNEQMLREGRPDRILAFHADIAQSRGTKHMIAIAEAANVYVNLVSSGAT